MGTLWIKDFRIGLDSRKGELALRPGTLLTALNGYITPGGEFTKRKAYVPPGSSLPSGTFGLQPTSTGLVTFGSDSTPAGFPNFALQGALLNYTRLQHPAVLAGTVYDAAKHAMTSAVLSENFGGLAWVVATFADGHSYPYYNGTPVYDFIDGLVLPDRATTALIATDLIAMINRSGRYTATSPGTSQLNIQGPLDTPFTLAITENSAGSISNTKLSDPVDSTSGVTAIAYLYVVGGSSAAGTNKVTSITVNAVTVTNASVDWTTSNEATAALLAASINAKVSSPEYTADSTGNKLSIIAALAAGSGPNGFVVVSNAAGNFCVGDFRATFQGTSYTVDHMYVNGTEILTATPYAFGPGTANTYTTLAALVAALVTNINSNTTAGTAHGYLAFASGNTLYFSKAVTSSSDVNIEAYFTITVPATYVGSVLYDNPISATGFTVSASPSAITKAVGGFTTVQSAEATVFTPNSPVLYTYHWRRTSVGTSKISIVTPNERITRFSIPSQLALKSGTPPIYPPFTEKFVCDVTDLFGFTVTTNEVFVTATL